MSSRHRIFEFNSRRSELRTFEVLPFGGINSSAFIGARNSKMERRCSVRGMFELGRVLAKTNPSRTITKRTVIIIRGTSRFLICLLNDLPTGVFTRVREERRFYLS